MEENYLLSFFNLIIDDDIDKKIIELLLQEIDDDKIIDILIESF
jgi:hypothetical protein